MRRSVVNVGWFLGSMVLGGALVGGCQGNGEGASTDGPSENQRESLPLLPDLTVCVRVQNCESWNVTSGKLALRGKGDGLVYGELTGLEAGSAQANYDLDRSFAALAGGERDCHTFDLRPVSAAAGASGPMAFGPESILFWSKTFSPATAVATPEGVSEQPVLLYPGGGVYLYRSTLGSSGNGEYKILEYRGLSDGDTVYVDELTHVEIIPYHGGVPGIPPVYLYPITISPSIDQVDLDARLVDLTVDCRKATGDGVPGIPLTE